MLNNIKQLINSKKEYMESNDLILEGTNLNDLDDSIVLGEDATYEPSIDTTDVENSTVVEEGNDDVKDDEGGNENNDTMNSDIMDTPIENNEPAGEPESKGDINDIMDSDINDVTGGLPTPVGKQTGEPITDVDILSTDINLASNTMNDVLPVPPAGAADALNDDFLSQRVDSGFGGDEDSTPSPENPLDSPTPPIDEGVDQIEMSPDPSEDMPMDEGYDFIEMSSDEPYFEEIIMGGDEEPATDGETKTGDTTQPTDEPMDDESSVTSAVKDKVAEADLPAEAEVPQGSIQETLMKKLASVTKSIEDVKLQVQKIAN